jgi:hypothetical protein
MNASPIAAAARNLLNLLEVGCASQEAMDAAYQRLAQRAGLEGASEAEILRYAEVFFIV